MYLPSRLQSRGYSRETPVNLQMPQQELLSGTLTDAGIPPRPSQSLQVESKATGLLHLH
jgi:hypothetical protein